MSKRGVSPPSYFYAEGRSLYLAARYFKDERIDGSVGVARKHRRKFQGSLFIRLMGNFEYMLKDLAGQIIDTTNLFDKKLEEASWLDLDMEALLAHKGEATSMASILFHSTSGWTDPETVNKRYGLLFDAGIINKDKFSTLETMWQVRHTLAHNGGFMTRNDAIQAGLRDYAEKPIVVDEAYFYEAFNFLVEIVDEASEELREEVFSTWFKNNYTDKWPQDEDEFVRLAQITELVKSRDKPAPSFDVRDYEEFIGRYVQRGSTASFGVDVEG